jgi:hypothetical protein
VNRRRRLALRLVLASLAAFVVAVTVVLVTLPAIARWVAVRQLTKITERRVTIDALDVRLLQGRFEVRGLHVADTDGGTLARSARIEGRMRLSSLLIGHVRVLDAVVESPTIRVVRTGPGEFNIGQLLGRERPAGGGGTVTIDRFTLRGGAVVVEDRVRTPARVWRVDGVEGELRDASTLGNDARGIATLRARAGDAPIAVDVSALHLAPLRFRATVSAAGLDVGLATLALPPPGAVSDVRGTAIASAAIERDAAGVTRGTVDLVLANVSLYRPGQERAIASVPALKATADLHARPGAVDVVYASATMATVVIEDTRHETPVRWAVDDLIVEARNLSTARDAPPGIATASARMQRARVDVYATDIRLSPPRLHATAVVRDADVTLVSLALPPGLPATPERGVVHATVRVDHDEQRGTRMALDGTLSDLVVRRPEHLVASPAIRVTAEEVSLAAGAVTVGRVRVAADRLTLHERAAAPPRLWIGENVVLEAQDLSSRRDHAQGVGTVRATVAGASVAAFVTQIRLAPLELNATANLRNVDLALVRLYLPPRAAVRRASGQANVSLNIAHTEAGGTRISGDAVLTQVSARVRPSEALRLDVSAPSLRVTVAEARRHGSDVHVGRVEVTGSGSVVDRQRPEARIDLTEVRLASDGLTWPARAPAAVELRARYGDRSELQVKGTAELTAPPPDLAWTAELGIQLSRVDLTPVGAWVPAANGLGGRLRGNVTASLAYAGTFTARVRGDVAGGRFTLTEGDRTLLALRRIDVVGLDAEWPERVTIERVKLQQPFALIERNREGRLALAARFAGAPAAETEAAPPVRRPALAVEEISVEDGSVSVQDEAAYTPVRLTVPRVALVIRDATWPSVKPARVVLDAQLPGGGTAKAEGTVAAEPTRIDLRVTLDDADLPLIQPYLAFRARLRGRVDAAVSVVGPIQPAPRVAVKGDATVRSLSFSDASRRVLTVERLGLEGIDAEWPERITIGRARAQRSWALIERDRQGQFLLRTLLERAVDRTPSAPAESDAATPAAGLAFVLQEAIFEDQGATIVDGMATPPARLEVAGARLHVKDLTWPSRGPAHIDITSPMPGGGTAQVAGTGDLDPVRLDVRVALKDVALEPAQAYVPIEGRLAGQVTGELAVKVGLAPFLVQIDGDAQLRRFTLSDGDRPVVSVARVDTAGIDVDWPQRIAVQRVHMRAPRLLVERTRDGEMTLPRLLTPRWTEVPSATPAPAAADRAGSVATAPPVIEVASITLERATGRFVDQTTTPPYAEELSRVELAFSPFTTAPGERTRFTGSGELAGGTFKVTGEGVPAKAMTVRVELRDVIVPRANPYLDRFTAWTASRGSLTVTAEYALDGTRLSAKHDVLVRNLEVSPSGARDEVEQRVGLPFGFLVSLLKDARGDIKLSLPVSGDLGTREFSFEDAMWGAIRSVAIRLLALPFSKVGSLFVSGDSKVEAVALTPVLFEPGGAQLAAGMVPHLERVTGFLQSAPSVKLSLAPILTQADVDALRREQVRARLGAGDALETARREFRARWPEREVPPSLDTLVKELTAAQEVPTSAQQALSTRRLDVVREALTRGGVVDAARLRGVARRRALVEEGGSPRVELDLRPETQVSESR